MTQPTNVAMDDDKGAAAEASSQMIFPVLDAIQSTSNTQNPPPTASPAPDSPFAKLLTDKMSDWTGSDGTGLDFETDIGISDPSDDNFSGGSLDDWDDLTDDVEAEADRDSTFSSGGLTGASQETTRREAVVNLGLGEIYTDREPFQNLGQSPSQGEPLPNIDVVAAPNGSAIIHGKDVRSSIGNVERDTGGEELDVESVCAESERSIPLDKWEIGTSTGSSTPDDDTVNKQMQELDERMAEESQKRVSPALEQSIMEWKGNVCGDRTAFDSEVREVSEVQQLGRDPESVESAFTNIDPQVPGAAISEALIPAISGLFTSQIEALKRRHSESEEELRGMIKALAEKVEHLESTRRSTHRPSQRRDRDRGKTMPSLSLKRRAAIRREIIQEDAWNIPSTETVPSDRTRPSPETATWRAENTMTPEPAQLSAVEVPWWTPTSSETSAPFTPPSYRSGPISFDPRSSNIPLASVRDTSDFFCPYGCPTCTDQTRRRLESDRTSANDVSFSKVSRRRLDRQRRAGRSIPSGSARVSIDPGSSLNMRISYR